jgi:hypothetical protein
MKTTFTSLGNKAFIICLGRRKTRKEHEMKSYRRQGKCRAEKI